MGSRIDLGAEGSTIRGLPQAFISKKGEAILVQTLDAKTSDGLLKMYLAYRPRNSFQGLPPLTDDACSKWVQHMIGNGVNLVAVAFGEGVVGHTALFPIDDRLCEMLVVVSRQYQNSGIGTHLTRCVVQLSYEIGFEKIWLPVEATNVRARHVYEKCGFDYLPRKDVREREMAIDLTRYHDAVKIDVEKIMNKTVITVHPDDSCRKAVEIFLSNRVGSLPVVDDDGSLVGILSESDLMLPSSSDKNVGDILTRDVLTVRVGCTVAKVIRMFQSKRIRCIPVVDGNDRVVGIIGRKDVLAYYARHW
jgi:CBS domain-containing protein/GNAT superfamily N-acetyltransferase